MPRLSDETWEIAKEKYVTDSSVTYEDLAKELQVNHATVERHGKKGDWPGLREKHAGEVRVGTRIRVAEMSEARAEQQSEKVDKGLRLVETYQAGLAGIIYQCLLRLGVVKSARNDDEAELVRKAPELWNAMDAKELNRVLSKAVDGQLDLLKQKALMTGGPTERFEVLSKNVHVVVNRTPTEQQEFERVVRRIRETAEDAGLKLPEG